jgi:phosphoenolpyruvate-protein kinase (PTS system EI component)
VIAVVGSGTAVGVTRTVTGTARHVADVQVVMELMGVDVSDTILLVADASATTVGPLLADALGIVCTSGGPTSHLALVAREFGVACVMAATLGQDLAELDEKRIEVAPDGTIAVVSV